MNKSIISLAVAAAVVSTFGLASCGSRDMSAKDTASNSPLVKPLIESAVPAGNTGQHESRAGTDSIIKREAPARTDQAHQVHPGRRDNASEAIAALPTQSPAMAGSAPPALSKQRRSVFSGIRGMSRADLFSGELLASIPRTAVAPIDRENYAHQADNPIKLAIEHPVSTFSIDVDTGSYSNVRRMLNSGRLPVQDALRVEELVNYFDYDYRGASFDKDQSIGDNVPFTLITEMGPSPWNRNSRLLHIGIKGIDIDRTQLPAANLVFLVDISGSMRSADKLALLKNSLKMLTRQLRSQDRITLVVYAGGTGVVLPPTPGDHRADIMAALDSLSAAGRTNGAAGIKLAYAMAEQAFIQGGINRVMLATDGDFNVGTVNFEALKDLVEEKRRSGVSLTTLGFGRGNYNDKLIEQLADAGNGNYAYIDTLNEARKVLVEQLSSTLKTIAKDVKIQIEFNPDLVSEYRLIGYENRILRREDFNNDRVDAGEIGAGHTVTALYELTLVGDRGRYIDSLRYGRKTAGRDAAREAGKANELAFLRLRYKQPGGDKSRLIEHPLYKQQIHQTLAATSERYRFAASVAGFAQLLKGGEYMQGYSWQQLRELAQASRGKDPSGYRSEFLSLLGLAESLSSQASRSMETRAIAAAISKE
ncbi:MAG: hypothetical protein BMS9Abin26_0042 [Gammaproteobacteria bacterium]|nr:MAG: hypothetical protein BMS9Abin26_0042 [Gammaproteobacteria bacterium]